MYQNMYGSNPYGMYNPAVVQPQPQRTTVDKVNGRNGAEMYSIAPDSSVLLLDQNNPMVWFIATDSAGYKTIIPYDIKQHEDEPVPDYKSIDSRLDSIDERIKAIEEALK